MTFDVAARVLLSVLIFVAAIHYAMVVQPAAIRGGWRRGWSVKIMLVGGLMGLLYAFAGQFKAMVLGIPFDAVSWWGLAAAVTFDAASAVVLWQRQRSERK